MEAIWLVAGIGLIAVVLAIFFTQSLTRAAVKSRMVDRAVWEEQQAQLQALTSEQQQLSIKLERSQEGRRLAEQQWAEWKAKSEEKAKENIQINNEHARRKAQLEAISRQLEQQQTNLTNLNQLAENLRERLAQTMAIAADWKSRHDAMEQRLAEQASTMEQYGQNLKREFQLLSEAVLSNKAEQFNQQQETKLNDLLTPLKEKLDGFKADISSKFETEGKERTRLEEQVRQMYDLNRRLSEQADGLTRALTTNVKQQGNWGETVLETILQYVGLQKDLHYQVQVSTTNEAGVSIRPDCIVRYPDNRYVVVDSKVSLLHYQQWNEAADAETTQAAQKLLLQSTRQHIDGLAAKRYDSIGGVLDMVIMFVPVEGAFILAMQQDRALWQYAFDRRILLVSPTLLIGSLRLIQEMWNRDAVNRNAQRIAEKAGQLYDKLQGFLANMAKVGKRLEDAQDAFKSAGNQLQHGRGNILKRAEEIRQLGAKTSKTSKTAGAIQSQDDANEAIDDATDDQEPDSTAGDAQRLPDHRTEDERQAGIESGA